jgi:hypothetical protein
VSDYERPVVTTETTDAQLEVMGGILWPCIEGDTPGTAQAATCVGVAFRQLLRCGQSPAQAVKTIGALSAFMSGLQFDEVDGPRYKPRGGW